MSTSATHCHGRRRQPVTERGQKILAFLDGKGLTLQAAAKRAGVSYGTLSRAVHGDPVFASVGTVVALCGPNLRVPIELVAPDLVPLVRATA